MIAIDHSVATDFHHKTARALVTDYDLIAVEGLKIKKT